ncbi:MAG: peptide-methionine (S)-S-oxide reductase MsrA [Bryobacteraceae bacterium]|nr:peptide-methionine (S)-S-oxide reductase MsrA [Bryobacteraceae bacterium]
MPNREITTLGGGCFWCLEAVYLEMEGVESVVSGYMGGHVDNPDYRRVCEGTTGHAEVVQLTFDPDITSFREILEVFFVIHDPTTKDRQGSDVGSQYRSAIFFHSEKQRQIAEDTVAELERDRAFSASVVTQIVPAETFWPAEDYHQNYFAQHSLQGYCMFVVAPKVKKFRSTFETKRRAAQ